ncbi:MAG: glycosyltransferase [Chromatiales bacterium]
MTYLEQFVLNFFLVYMLIAFGVYTTLNLLALFWFRKYAELRENLLSETLLTGHEPGVSIIVPAYNEAGAIVSSVRSLLQQQYGDFEVIVVNDGSTDDTLAMLTQAFELYSFPQAYCRRVITEPVRGVYRSRVAPRLRVVDKENGGSKADAANAGLNTVTRPLFCCMDADSVLDRYALLRTVQFFLDDKRVVACGGTLRPLNGCVVEEGNLVKDGLPRNPLALFQVLEYLRSFLCGRVGWAQLHALLIISGGYGVFRTENVIAAGGYDHASIGEDMDLVLRLHRAMLRAGTPYRLQFAPETTCWTEVPESLRVFGNQRARWQRGLGQCLWRHRSLFFSLRAPMLGWVALPFFLLVELLSPPIELAGYVVFAYFSFTGRLDLLNATVVMTFAIALSILLSTTSLLLDTLSPDRRGRVGTTLTLVVAALFEPLLYHPIHTYYRLLGTFQWIMRRRPSWGVMTRSTRWQKS